MASVDEIWGNRATKLARSVIRILHGFQTERRLFQSILVTSWVTLAAADLDLVPITADSNIVCFEQAESSRFPSRWKTHRGSADITVLIPQRLF